MTDVYEKSAFPQWNRRKRKKMELERLKQCSPEAQTIKYADILDNSQEITAHAPDFAPRYLEESLSILQEADQGNEALRKLTLEKLKEERRALRTNS